MGRRSITKSNVYFYFAFFGVLFLSTILYHILIWVSNISLMGWIIISIISIGLIVARRKIREHQTLKVREERRKELMRQGNLNQLMKMHPRQFELFVRDLYRQLGYDAHVTSTTGDGGKDVLIYKGNFFAIVECKRYGNTTKVTRPDIQKFHSAVIDCKAEAGYFITTGEFTGQAVTYVIDKPIILINGEKLIDMIEEVTNLGMESIKS